MKERLLEFLKAENKSSAQLAEEIGVQPSGISHILSGRNNPSLDFVLKMLARYEFISTDWLMFGRGKMYRDQQMQSLFDEDRQADPAAADSQGQSRTDKSQAEDVHPEPDLFRDIPSIQSGKGRPAVSRIVIFYEEGTFSEYFPKG